MYFPLEVAAVESENPPQLIQSPSGNIATSIPETVVNPPDPARPNEESATRNDDGIEQVVADDLNTSLSPNVLVIQEATETNKGDSPQSPDCNGSPLLHNLSSMAVDDAFMEEVTPAAEALNSCQISSPRFSFFLHRTEETELTTEAPQMIGLETPLHETTPGNPLGKFPPTAENPRPSTVESPKMVITRREVLAITNILGRIPQSVLNDPDPASTNNFTFSVIEDPPVPPSKGLTREPSARTDDRDLE